MTQPMRKRDLPFPRHWRAYITLKIVLIAVAVLIAILYFSGWWA